MRDPLRYFRNNTANTLILTEASVAAGCPAFIFSSTAAVYGVPDGEVVDEQAPTRPISPYGASKLASEAMLRATAAAHPAFRPVILRYFNVAGADPLGRTGQRADATTDLIGAVIQTALGRRRTLEVFGDDYATRDGSCERDFVHVSDLAAAHVSALRHLQGGGAPDTFNVGYGRGCSVLEVIAAAEALLGRPLPVRRAPRRSGDAGRVISDPSRIQAAFDWRPRHQDLNDILSTALAWHKGR